MTALPQLPPQHIEQEIEHIKGIKRLLDAGWTMTGIVLVDDPKTYARTKPLTLFPSEQAQVAKLLKTLCADRVKQLVKQRPKAKGRR